MRLLLKACFGSIDEKGSLVGKDLRDKDTEYLTEVISTIEIEGVKFSASMKSENELTIVMGGSDLSSAVTPNYLDKINVVKQIVHKSPEAKFTSSVLNKFVRRSNKILSKEPCNTRKRQPPNIILIKVIEEID